MCVSATASLCGCAVCAWLGGVPTHVTSCALCVSEQTLACAAHLSYLCVHVCVPVGAAFVTSGPLDLDCLLSAGANWVAGTGLSPEVPPQAAHPSSVVAESMFQPLAHPQGHLLPLSFLLG